MLSRLLTNSGYANTTRWMLPKVMKRNNTSNSLTTGDINPTGASPAKEETPRLAPIRVKQTWTWRDACLIVHTFIISDIYISLIMQSQKARKSLFKLDVFV
jgi:hypothetical protein